MPYIPAIPNFACQLTYNIGLPQYRSRPRCPRRRSKLHLKQPDLYSVQSVRRLRGAVSPRSRKAPGTRYPNFPCLRRRRLHLQLARWGGNLQSRPMVGARSVQQCRIHEPRGRWDSIRRNSAVWKAQLYPCLGGWARSSLYEISSFGSLFDDVFKC